jgi:integrase
LIIRAELPTQQQPTTRDLPIETLLKIQKVSDALERLGKAKNTRDGFNKHIQTLANREITDKTGKHKLNLDNTAEVELAIARWKLIDPKTRKVTTKNASNCYKDKLIHQYDHYRKFYKLNWSTGEKPIYKPEERGIIPPSDEKCAILMASFKMPLSLKVDISTQTGLRPIEVTGEKGIRVKDFHPDQKAIVALSTKGCNARPPMNITTELCSKIQEYIHRKGLSADDLLFTCTSKGYGEEFRRARNRLAKKLNDTTIKSIRLYDLRHYYVTKILRKIQNTEIVRQKVGHKNLNTTQRYMHLLAENYTGEFIIEQTQDRKRAAELEASGFTYSFTTPDGWMQFKKPK